MGEIITIGLDLAKSVFQVHAVDEAGKVVLRRQIKRAQLFAFFAGLSPCLAGKEACSGAHFWARELGKLGHDARLMPPSLCEAQCQARQDRCSRRGSNFRSFKLVAQQSNDPGDRLIAAQMTRPNMRVRPEAHLRHDAGGAPSARRRSKRKSSNRY